MSEGSGTSYLRRRLMTMFALLAIASVFGTVDEVGRAIDDRAFDARGKHALSLPETHLSGSTSSEVALSYIDADDRVVLARPIALNPAGLATVRAGGRIDIVYLPDRPKTVRRADWERSLVPLWVGPLMLVLGVVGFTVLWRGRR